MRASERCAFHYQGDYCRLAAGHGDRHEGAHSNWLSDDVKPNHASTMPIKTFRWLMDRSAAIIRYMKVGR